MNGYIKLYRQIFANEIWNDNEPFDRRSAWIDLLLLANHSDHTAIVKGHPVKCKRGQVNRSVYQLAERWNWSRGKARRFIDLLESLKMCTTDSTTDGTTITIENYARYQGERPTSDTTDDTTGGTTDGQVTVLQTDTYNKGNKEKESKRMNEKEERSIREKLLRNANKKVPEALRSQHQLWLEALGGRR